MSELHPLDTFVTEQHPVEEGRPRRRSHAAQLRRKRRRRRIRGLLVLLLTLVVVVGGAYEGYSALRPSISSMFASKDYKGDGTGSVTVTILAGQSGRSIGETLANDGVVKTAGAFADAAAANPDAAGIQPGTYQMHLHMSASSALGLLLDPSARLTDRVTVREGLRATAVIALLSQQTGQPLSDYQNALKDPAALGLPAFAKGHIEGMLFPATYTFEPDTSAKEQLTQMVTAARRALATAKVSDAEAERVLTIASIVQVEARAAADGPKVARVLDNRLNQGMKLQLDSTVSYVTGKPGVATTAADRANPSPYNTYVHAGLPPGPISNPGLAAIEAALHPATGTWLYFVTVNPTTGETRFATTAAEARANTALFQAWCAAHSAACHGTG
jgi:UPF0755 protein